MITDLLQDLDPNSANYCDLALTNDSLTIIGGIDVTRQLLTQRLRTFAGECIFNAGLGIPYIQQIFQKGITQPILEGIFRQAILETPDVLGLIDFTLELDKRNLTVTFTAQTTLGVVTVPLVV